MRTATAGHKAALGLLLFLSASMIPAAAAKKKPRGHGEVHLAGVSGAKAKEFFDRGNTAYEAGRYADALVSYRESFKLAPVPVVLHNIAYCEELLGDEEAAFVDYQRFMDIAPEDHKYRAEVDRKLSAMKLKVEVKVQVTSSPSGAAVFVDGSRLIAGIAPVTLKLLPGQHRLKFVADHALPDEQVVEARVGERLAVEATLTRFAQVDILAEPSDAVIVLGEGEDSHSRSIGRYSSELAPGIYRVTTTHPDYQPSAFDLIVRGGETIYERVALSKTGGRSTGTLVVRSDTSGASVYLDALPAGATPEARMTASTGVHQLTVERVGYRSWHGRVKIDLGATTTVDVNLADDRRRATEIALWSMGGVGIAAAISGLAVGGVALEDEANFRNAGTLGVDDGAQEHGIEAGALLLSGAALTTAAAIGFGLTGRHPSEAVITIEHPK